MSTTLAQPPATAPASTALSRYSAVALGFMIVVILEGAVVRATGSGAGCGNHWPLCNGQVIPVHPRVATIIEFVHRQLTTVCTLLVVGLIVFTFRAKPAGHRARRAVVWSGVLLLSEAALGAILVKGGYVEANASNMRVLVQCIHFTNTMLLMAALTLAWWWSRERSPVPAVRRAHPVAWIALAATLLVGATGSVAALADTLFPSPTLLAALQQDFAANAPLLIRMRWLHPAAAIVGLGAAIALSLLVRAASARWLLTLIAAQFVLGTADVLLLAPTWLQVLHLLGADLYWIALVAVGASILYPSPRGINPEAPTPLL
jgi:cytochrome c oxidase assembly protein subunit 15